MERIKLKVPQIPEDSKTGLSYDYLNEMTLACFVEPDVSTLADFIRDVKEERGGKISHYEERYPIDYYTDTITEKNRPFVEGLNKLVDELNLIVQHPEGHNFTEVKEIDKKISTLVGGRYKPQDNSAI